MNTHHTTSHASLLAIFTTLVLILAIPLIILTSQNPQDLRQRAATTSKAIDNLEYQHQSKSGYLEGYVYLDQNQNGERDYNEISQSNIPIKITLQNTNPALNQQNIIATISTDSQGFFKYNLSSLPSYSLEANIELILPLNYKTQNTNPKQIIKLSPGTSNLVEFGIYPISDIYTMPSTAIPPRAR